MRGTYRLNELAANCGKASKTPDATIVRLHRTECYRAITTARGSLPGWQKTDATPTDVDRAGYAFGAAANEIILGSPCFKLLQWSRE